LRHTRTIKYSIFHLLQICPNVTSRLKSRNNMVWPKCFGKFAMRLGIFDVYPYIKYYSCIHIDYSDTHSRPSIFTKMVFRSVSRTCISSVLGKVAGEYLKRTPWRRRRASPPPLPTYVAYRRIIFTANSSPPVEDVRDALCDCPTTEKRNAIRRLCRTIYY